MRSDWTELLWQSGIFSLLTPAVLLLLGILWVAAAHGDRIRKLTRFRGGVLLVLGSIPLPMIGMAIMLWLEVVLEMRDPGFRIMILPMIFVAPPIMILVGVYLMIDAVLPGRADDARREGSLREPPRPREPAVPPPIQTPHR